MKLLVFHPSLAPYRVDFFNSLSNHFDAKFFFFHKNVLDQKFNQNNLKKALHFDCAYLTKGISLFGRPFRFGIGQIIKHNRPDMILCPEYGLITLYIVMIRVLFKKKYKVCTICDDSIMMSETTRKVRRLFRGYLLKRLDAVILTNPEIISWYNSNLNTTSKLLTFPIIIDETRFRKKLSASIPTANQIIETYKLAGKKVVLFVGRLVTVKNLNRLIHAFSKIDNKDAVLVLVGSGYKENELKTLVNTLELNNRIIFAGRQEGDRLLAWYVATHLFVLASISEAFGAVINEALISGSKILCSNLAGARCLINTKNGIVFNPYDENVFVEAIAQELATVPPVHHITALHPSLMTMPYKTAITALISQLQSL